MQECCNGERISTFLQISSHKELTHFIHQFQRTWLIIHGLGGTSDSTASSDDRMSNTTTSVMLSNSTTFTWVPNCCCGTAPLLFLLLRYDRTSSSTTTLFIQAGIIRAPRGWFQRWGRSWRRDTTATLSGIWTASWRDRCCVRHRGRTCSASRLGGTLAVLQMLLDLDCSDKGLVH